MRGLGEGHSLYPLTNINYLVYCHPEDAQEMIMGFIMMIIIMNVFKELNVETNFLQFPRTQDTSHWETECSPILGRYS